MGAASGDALRDVSHTFDSSERDVNAVQPATVGDGGRGGFIYGEESVGCSAGKFCTGDEYRHGYAGRTDCDCGRGGVFCGDDGQLYSRVRFGNWQGNMEV